jgi:Spy/CpxP family protein refolding chaperone
MMGGYGMGPGMMGGGSGPGYGMGPGMMGPGMMGGYGGMPSDLSAEQRTKLTEIQQEFRQKQRGVMQSMHSLMGSAEGMAPGAFDEQAARKNYDAVAALHKQMFENHLEARKRMDALLTPQQREQLRLRRSAR